MKRFKFRIASGAALLVFGLFAVSHGAGGVVMLALVLVAIGVVAFKVL